MRLNYAWYNTVSEIDISSWEGIYNNTSIYKLFSYWRALAVKNITLS